MDSRAFGKKATAFALLVLVKMDEAERRTTAEKEKSDAPGGGES